MNGNVRFVIKTFSILNIWKNIHNDVKSVLLPLLVKEHKLCIKGATLAYSVVINLKSNVFKIHIKV